VISADTLAWLREIQSRPLAALPEPAAPSPEFWAHRARMSAAETFAEWVCGWAGSPVRYRRPLDPRRACACGQARCPTVRRVAEMAGQ
jgi:hypothetical protein